MKTFHISNFSFLLIAVIAIVLLSGCDTTKHLGARETFLKTNKIVFDKSDKIKGAKNLRWELETLYKQKPNKPFLWAKRRYFYYKHSIPPEKGDTVAIKKYNKSWSRLMRKRFAETPAIYREKSAENTSKSMEYYLNNKGYYYAEVEHISETKGNYTNVIYKIKPKKQYTIDSVFFESEDPHLTEFFEETENETLLKQGKPVSDEVFNAEFDRIISGMNNRGFAFFEKNFIKSYGDSSDLKVKVYIKGLTPNDALEHKKYTIGKVSIVPNYLAYFPDSLLRDSIIDGYHFLLNPKGIPVKPKIILNALHIRSGDIYNKSENIDRTKVSLRLLEPYKSENITLEIDSLDDSKLNFLIRLTLQEKMELSGGLEFNFSDYAQSSGPQTLIGFAASSNFRNRNAFKNATVFEANVSAGFDFNFNTLFSQDTLPLIFSKEISASANFYLPKFMDYLGLAKRLNKIKVDEDEKGRPEKLISDRFYRDLKDRARTRISLFYDAVNISNFYSYQTFNATLGFTLQRDQKNTYAINQVGINYFLPKPEMGFDSILMANPFIQRSFTPQLFTGLFFRDFGYIYNGPQNINGTSWFGAANVELSGVEVLLANAIYNGFADIPVEFQLGLANGDNISFSQYIKLNLEGRYNRILSSRHSLAFRAFGGVIFPYGFSKGGEVPYVKQFYGGGPNGIRGWRARELGPGGFKDPLAQGLNAFYQTGDLQLEFNAEYRFDIPILEALKGAFFVDMGNVWTLQRDTARVNSRFRISPESASDGSILNDSFIKQIAISAGAGIRIDISYFVLRLDAAIKIRSPFLTDNDKIWFPEAIAFRNVNWNLGVGYPF